jgi:hypothetical protein
MNLREIESWALRVIERVVANHPSEDSLVELKTTWPEDSNKAGRRIAGHANAARGEPILWLIGVDQDNGVQGVVYAELANWWLQIQAEFNGVSPTIWDLNISWNDRTVVALLFETERAPFVVRNQVFGQPGGGSVELEVPWREGTRTRSATHNDLVLLLSPSVRVPYSEIISAALSITGRIESEGKREYFWVLDFKVFINPMVGDRLVLLDNRCSGSFEIPHRIPRTELVNWHVVNVAGERTAKLENGFSMEAPSIVRLRAEGRTLETDNLDGEIQIEAKILPVNGDRPIIINATLMQTVPITNSLFMWRIIGSPLPWGAE